MYVYMQMAKFVQMCHKEIVIYRTVFMQLFSKRKFFFSTKHETWQKQLCHSEMDFEKTGSRFKYYFLPDSRLRQQMHAREC